MPMNAPRGIPLRNVPAPADAPEAPPDRTRATCPFALQRPSLILSQSHVYAACPEQWPRARPSPPRPSARTPPVPRETRGKKAPWEPADRVRRRKPHQKPRAERARGLSLGPPSPQPPTNDSSRRKRNGHFPGAGASSQRQARPSFPTGALRTNASPSPAKRAAKAPPEGTSRPPPTPAQRFPSLRPVFPGTPPRMGMRPGKSGAFRHQTRQLARRTLLSRAESAQPGALGMPANAKIALIYKNQVRFCFPGWRTFSTPGAPLTALPRAPRCRVHG